MIATQHNQQETLVHVISILKITRHATQVDRQHINIVMNAVERTHQGVTTLYNNTHSLYSSLSYQQILLHIHSILANLRDSLYYMREVTIHTMDNIDAATTRILSPHVLPVEDLRKMLLHIEETLPSTMHLPVPSEGALHLYRYLSTYVLTADKQFLLLINAPIQDCAQQLKLCKVLNLAIPHGNFSACYNINSRYLGIMHDDTKAVGDFRITVQHLPKDSQTGFQFKYTSSTTCKSTNVYSSFICQGQSWHQEKMLTTNQESQ